MEIVVLREIWRTASWLCQASSILSLVLLLKLGFDIGFVEPLKLMLEWYRSAVEFCLGWAEPALKIVIQQLSNWLPVHLQLYPYWKHIFVPMWLYFGADARTAWREVGQSSALFTVVWGGLIALATSVASATAPLDSRNLFPMVSCAIGFVVYSFGKAVWDGIFFIHEGYTRWQAFWYYAIAYPLGNALIAAGVIFVGLRARQLDFPSLSVVLLIVFVIAFALRNIVVSAYIATFGRAGGESWVERFRSFPTQEHGFLILRAISIAALMVAFNAGLKLAGLS